MLFGEQTERDLLWILEPISDLLRMRAKFVVYGHTALETQQIYKNGLNSDGGAGYGRPLTPLVVERLDYQSLGPKDRDFVVLI